MSEHPPPPQLPRRDDPDALDPRLISRAESGGSADSVVFCIFVLALLVVMLVVTLAPR